VHAALHGQINFSPLFSINFTEVGIIVLLRHTNSTTAETLYIPLAGGREGALENSIAWFVLRVFISLSVRSQIIKKRTGIAIA
jgi:hypothetical protein